MAVSLGSSVRGLRTNDALCYLLMMGSQEAGREPSSGLEAALEERSGTERREAGKAASWPGGGISVSTVGAGG